MSNVDADVWTCPDCHDTVRGNAAERREAQEEHAAEHANDRQIQARRRTQDADDRAQIRADRRRRAADRRKARGGGDAR